MRRADRLFQIIQIMRAGQLVTATRLAEKLEVSERTIYRDIADLKANRVPIDGEAGIGYLLRAGYDLPPLMFNREELSALYVAARLLTGFGGDRMASAASDALAKIETVLPDELKDTARSTPVYAIRPWFDTDDPAIIDTIHKAINSRNLVHIRYQSADGTHSERTIEPLGLICWGQVWTLVAWCRLRNNFRSFRPDRMLKVEIADETYEDDPERSINAWLNQHSQTEGRQVPAVFRNQFSL